MGFKHFLGPLERAGCLFEFTIGAIGPGTYGVDGSMLAHTLLARNYEAIAR